MGIFSVFKGHIQSEPHRLWKHHWACAALFPYRHLDTVLSGVQNRARWVITCTLQNSEPLVSRARLPLKLLGVLYFLACPCAGVSCPTGVDGVESGWAPSGVEAGFTLN